MVRDFRDNLTGSDVDLQALKGENRGLVSKTSESLAKFVVPVPES
jgi:hypothetical protein